MATPESNTVQLFTTSLALHRHASQGAAPLGGWDETFPNEHAAPTELDQLLPVLSSDIECWPRCFQQQIRTAIHLLEFAETAPQRSAEDWKRSRPLETYDYLAARYSPSTQYRHLGLHQSACALRAAVEQTQRCLHQTMLECHGLLRVEVWPDETIFDAVYHEEQAGVPHPVPPTSDLNEVIAQVMRNGYLLAGEVIRKARVLVYSQRDDGLSSSPSASTRW